MNLSPKQEEFVQTPAHTRRGRGALSNASSRFDREQRFISDDGWDIVDQLTNRRTEVFEDFAKTIVNRNSSPDIPFDQSINPYKGCEHGCTYCYARPTHAFLGLSPGLDFETKIFAKPNAAKLLEEFLDRPGYKPKTIAMGTNTDPYQPIERSRKITRSILKVLAKRNHPVSIVTKSSLVQRDSDILGDMGQKGLAKVAISVTSLDHRLSRKMEPRAASPMLRLKTIRALTKAGVPTGLMFAPVIPGLNDHELEAILRASRDEGALEAGYVMLRLPLEIKDLFEEWLNEAYPDRAKKVMRHVRDVRGGKANDPRFGYRMVGTGPIAALVRRRFKMAVRRMGLNENLTRLRTDMFERVPRAGEQMRLI